MLVIHRQGGKTHAVLQHLLRDALTHQTARYAYIAPTYKQAKNVAWERLKDIVRKIPHEKNETELSIKFPNGSSIYLYGADNPDSLRGITLFGVVFDEYSQQPGNIFEEIIYPTLSTTNGYAIWIGTPKGKNQLYDLYRKALSNPEEYLVVFKTIEDTIAEESGPTVENLTTALADAKKLVEAGLMTEDAFSQELYCSFDASVKGAYYAEQIAKARAEGRIKPVPYQEDLLVYTVWDLGISDATSIGFYQKDGNQIRMIDYYENQGQGLPHYITTLRTKNYVYGAHYAPHDIKQREFTTGRSRQEIAQELGISFNIIPDLSVAEGINAGRLVFNRLVLDSSRTSEFVDKISRYHKKFDDKNGIFLDRPEHDGTSHAADVHRYMALVENNFSAYEPLPTDFSMFHEYA